MIRILILLALFAVVLGRAAHADDCQSAKKRIAAIHEQRIEMNASAEQGDALAARNIYNQAIDDSIPLVNVIVKMPTTACTVEAGLAIINEMGYLTINSVDHELWTKKQLAGQAQNVLDTENAMAKFVQDPSVTSAASSALVADFNAHLHGRLKQIASAQ